MGREEGQEPGEREKINRRKVGKGVTGNERERYYGYKCQTWVDS